MDATVSTGTILENLAVDLQVEILDRMGPNDLKILCEACSDIKYDWKNRSKTDFNFPPEVYIFMEYREKPAKPSELYFKIQEMIPSPKNLDILTRLSRQWDYEANHFRNPLIIDYTLENDNIFTPHCPTTPEGITSEEANKFLDEIDDIVDQDFISCNHLYLHCVYTTYNIQIPNIRIKRDIKILIREYRNFNMTYRTILEHSRAFFEPNSNGYINYFTFTGFHSDGIPILGVDIDD